MYCLFRAFFVYLERKHNQATIRRVRISREFSERIAESVELGLKVIHSP